MAAWYPVRVISIILLLILAAGCIDTSTDSPPLPTMSTLPIPGVTQHPAAQILQSSGEVIGQGTQGGIIDTITFTVSLSNLSKSIDMEHLGIVYSDVVRTETILPVEGYWGEPPQGCWSIVRVVNEAGGPNNLLEQGEQFVIRVNPKAPIVPTQLITIQVKPADGNSLAIRRIAPKTIRAENILSPV
jgi:archaellin